MPFSVRSVFPLLWCLSSRVRLSAFGVTEYVSVLRLHEAAASRERMHFGCAYRVFDLGLRRIFVDFNRAANGSFRGTRLAPGPHEVTP